MHSRACKPIFVTSTPSMMIVPDAGSMMRNRASSSDDFPDPVRPTIPIFSRAFCPNVRRLWTTIHDVLTIFIDMPLRTRSRSGRYLVEYSLSHGISCDVHVQRKLYDLPELDLSTRRPVYRIDTREFCSSFWLKFDIVQDTLDADNILFYLTHRPHKPVLRW